MPRESNPAIPDVIESGSAIIVVVVGPLGSQIEHQEVSNIYHEASLKVNTGLERTSLVPWISPGKNPKYVAPVVETDNEGQGCLYLFVSCQIQPGRSSYRLV